jgi:hypothetical protein
MILDVNDHLYGKTSGPLFYIIQMCLSYLVLSSPYCLPEFNSLEHLHSVSIEDHCTFLLELL